MTKFKILVGMLQLTTNFGRILGIEWPFAINLTIDFFSFVNLDFLRMFPTGCVVPSSHFAGLVFMTTTPLFLTACLVGVYVVSTLTVCAESCACRCCRRRADPNAPDSFAAWAKKSAVPTELALLFFVFPGITTKTFRTFICERFDNGDGDVSDNVRYLSADLSVRCDGGAYGAMMGYALASAALYCVGIPALFACLLWRARDHVHPRTGGAIGDLLARERSAAERPMRVGAVSFLYADYKPSAWWYELFVMGRKLFMSGVLVFVYEGTATQIVVALLVALGAGEGSRATSVRASLLYILMMRRAPSPSSTFWFASNCFIGSSMRLSRWRDHVMLPATGGKLRGTGGSCFCFSYSCCTCSSSMP